MRGSHQFLQYCSRIRQFVLGSSSVVVLIGSFTCKSVVADDYKLKLWHLNPDAVVPDRMPATYVPDDEAISAPVKLDVWYDKMFAEDSAGVMAGVRGNLSKWEAEEEYVKQWNLESANIYERRTTDYKESYIRSKVLKYLDKRISGEIKQAEKGSTLHRVGKVQKALKPAGKVTVAKNIKLKFKVRVLEGKGRVMVDNPYVDYVTHFNAKGEVNTKVKKEFKQIGVKTQMNYEVGGPVTMNVAKKIKSYDAKASIDYNATSEVYVAALDKKLAKNLNAKLSSSQDNNQAIFTEDSNTTLQFYYNTPF